jgi:hypothetical protein
MAIVTLDGPQDATNVIGRALHHLSATQTPSALGLRQASAPKVTRPIRVFTVPVDEITSTEFFRSARQIGWRYLVLDGTPNPRAIAAADLRETAEGGSSFGSLFHGHVPERLAEASQFAQEEYGSQPGDYEVRILELPSLYLSALWLVGPNDTHAFIPYLNGNEPAPPPIRLDPEFPAKVLLAANRRGQAQIFDPNLSN